MDINQYIEPRQQTFLSNVEYRLLELVASGSKNVINVADNLEARFLDPKHIKLTLTRKLTFNPAGLFELSVSFGTILTLREDSYYLVDWKTYDVAEEIVRNSKNLINPLAARISLLIAEITSSYGQNPIVTPPTVITK
ncbi:MAG: hypothetical protein SO386_07320 [Eubacteriales bacterium]|jgi:hypothetical protein|nr:hypothetical protein [Eubacteriales bacterium]